MGYVESWFDALGKPVHDSQARVALDLLVGEGYDKTETSMVLAVVAREIEHDNPQACFRYLRSHLGEENETLVLRTLATLAAPTIETRRDDLLQTLEALEPNKGNHEQAKHD